MLFKDKSVQRQRLLYVIVLPMLLVVAGSTLVFNTSRAKDMVADVEESVNGLTVTDEQTLPSQSEELKNGQVNEDSKVYKDPEIMAIPVGGMKKYVMGLSSRIT
jgi:hypothetical protein